MKLSLLLKITAFAFLLAIASLIINLRSDLLAWKSLWQAETFRWAFIATLGLLLGYACWISFCQFFWRNNKYIQIYSYSPSWRFVFYMLIAVLPVVFVHTSLLQVVLAHYSSVIYRSTYWRLDFPYFIGPVLAYTMLVYRWPSVFNILPQPKPEQLVVVKKEISIEHVVEVKEVIRIEEVITEREVFVPDALLKSWSDERNPMFLLRYL